MLIKIDSPGVMSNDPADTPSRFPNMPNGPMGTAAAPTLIADSNSTGLPIEDFFFEMKSIILIF